MLTTTQAGERLGITDQRIRELIKEGILPAKRIGRFYIIDSDDLADANKRKKRPGPEPQSDN